ncbi:Mth938-like domain-containing protein [Limnobacter litoralis]|uniref:Uncharacterized protein n=1 Tax=Limnobacter litoralis TaxID=481366 RepID=A0ABQ5YQL9_9BURK|nr:Mth938-like domain-containing protein [Limnobacter litoralis]GLR25746.1 hypothetical protein GCM10007875_08340 [Limnobacter litoralis]
MKFQPEIIDGQHIVQSYDSEGVVINGKKHAHSVVFGTNLPVTQWENASLDLSTGMFEWLYSTRPEDTEVLIIGTGAKQVFPSADIRRFFAQKNCPVEYMDTQAACRTYNILVGEGRHVVAAILI